MRSGITELSAVVPFFVKKFVKVKVWFRKQ